MKIGDRIYVRGYIDEIRKDAVIVRNDGGYFGTIPSEVITGELPSAQPEPHWIPCSERLPEVCGRYLVTRGLNACGSLWNRIYIANYSNLMGIKSVKIWWQGNVGKSDFERLDDVLAWMPLPEPYREGES